MLMGLPFPPLLFRRWLFVTKGRSRPIMCRCARPLSLNIYTQSLMASPSELCDLHFGQCRIFPFNQAGFREVDRDLQNIATAGQYTGEHYLSPAIPGDLHNRNTEIDCRSYPSADRVGADVSVTSEPPSSSSESWFWCIVHDNN